MTTSDLAARANDLRARHLAGPPLVLPNAWDAASAVAVQQAGFGAVATTSAGVAQSLGWPDGEQAPAAEMLGAVARIARAVDVPVTADLEAGYGLGADALVAALLEAGAVGCNLEDTDHAHGGVLAARDVQAEWLATVRDAARAAGVPIVLNARVDVFLRSKGTDDELVDDAADRAAAYASAGADCVYPIFATTAQLAAFGRRHEGPTNALVFPGVADLSSLRDLGVARISFGSGLHHREHADLASRLEVIAEGRDDWAA